MASTEELHPAEKETSRWKLSNSLSYKIHFFLLSGAHVGVMPYLPVYAKTTLGVSATAIGLLSTSMQFSTTISKPVFGLLADCLSQVKSILISLICLEVFLNLLMLALPSVDGVHGMYNILNSAKRTENDLPLSPAKVYDVDYDLRAHKDLNETTPETLRRRSLWVPSESQHVVNRTNTSTMHSSSNEANNLNGVKCFLSCPSVVQGATCHQNLKFCLDPHATNTLTCTAKSQITRTYCDGFQRNAEFNLAYSIKNFSNDASNEFHLLPHSFLYKRKSFRNWKKYTCNVTSISCHLLCEHNLHFCVQKKSMTNVYHTYQFWTFCFFAVVTAMCQGTLYTLSDTACYESLRNSDTDFGRQRLWGSIGWGCIAPLTGFLNDFATNYYKHDDYSPGWYLMAVLSVFFLFNLLCLKLPKLEKSENMGKQVWQVIERTEFILMATDIFFVGILTAVTTNYVIWYLESLGCDKLQMGLAMGIQCLLGEVPLMYFAGWFITHLGHWHIISITYLAFAARFGGYFFIADPWLILPVELLSGITFGLFYTTMTSHAELVSSPGTEATIQGIYGGIFQGLGSGVGCLIAGIAFDSYGGQKSFLFLSIFSACAAVIHCFLTFACNSFSRKEVGMIKMIENI